MYMDYGQLNFNSDFLSISPQELNKLRIMVFTYSLPTVIDKICQVLSNEESFVSNPQAKSIIQRSIQFLSSNHNPQDKLTLLGSK